MRSRTLLLTIFVPISVMLGSAYVATRLPRPAAPAPAVIIESWPATVGQGHIYRRPRWAHADGCRDTRAVVLAAQCSSVTWRPRAGHPEGCTIAQATCLDLYSGAEVSTDSASSALQVDHIFPAHIAWLRRTWTADGWTSFFNDTANLQVTRARTNERKSDLMPDGWCPSSPAARRSVAASMRATAAKYSLTFTLAELQGLAAWERGECLEGAKVL